MASAHREVAARQGRDRIGAAGEGNDVIGKFARFAMAFRVMSTTPVQRRRRR